MRLVLQAHSVQYRHVYLGSKKLARSTKLLASNFLKGVLPTPKGAHPSH